MLDVKVYRALSGNIEKGAYEVRRTLVKRGKGLGHRATGSKKYQFW